MAEVFLAMQRGPAGFQKLIVVKRLRGGMGNDPHFERMFLNEARLAARLNHPNVVQTFEVGVDGNVHFIAMEYLAGQPVNKVLAHASKNRQAFPLMVRLQLVSDCLAGLDYAHGLTDFDGQPLGIVHRDISPHNVFVTYDGVTKVVDFGIAKTTESPQFAELSTAGSLKGKIRYMAPEQLRGEPVDRRADVFSVGVLLWEAVANGNRMWADTDDITVIMQLSDGIAPDPQLADPNVDPDLAFIMRKALAGNVADRYRSAEAFRLDLDRYIARLGGPASAREIGALIQSAFANERQSLDRSVRDAIDEAESELDEAQTVLRSREDIQAAMRDSGHESEAVRELFRTPSSHDPLPRIEHSTSAVVVAPLLLSELADSNRGLVSDGAGALAAPPPSGRALLLAVGALTLVGACVLGALAMRPRLHSQAAAANAAASNREAEARAGTAADSPKPEATAAEHQLANTENPSAAGALPDSAAPSATAAPSTTAATTVAATATPPAAKLGGHTSTGTWPPPKATAAPAKTKAATPTPASTKPAEIAAPLHL
jgi:eukaryotic-like serine/threonine-protein kinase